MPSKPCEKVPGSNSTVVWPKSASTQEWPKCVSCMSTIVRSRGAAHARSRGDDADRERPGGGVRIVAAPPTRTRTPARRCATRSPTPRGSRRPSIPLNSTYRWPSLAGLAVPMTGTTTPRFRFEEVCATPAFPQDTRNSAVAAGRRCANPQGQWQLQAQVLHWRGDTARGGQTASSVFGIAARRAARLPTGGAGRVAVGHRRRAATGWPR